MARKPLENVVACLRALVAAQEAEYQSDQDLIRAFSTKNDNVAFAALVKRHGPMVFSVCMRVLHQIQDAEDAFQAVFIVLARYATSLGKRQSLAGWLHQVSCRVAQHARRAAQRRQFHESKVRVMEPADPECQAAWREVQVLLDNEIQRLPDRYREPFVLCHLENLSCARAARQLGLKEGTVWSRLAEARKRLQTRLTRRGVALSAALGAVVLGPKQTVASLPVGLAAAAVRVATASNGGVVATGLVSKQVAALVKGTTVSLLVTKTKAGVAILLAAIALGAAGLLGSHQAPAATPAGWPQDGAVLVQEARKSTANPRLDLYGDPLPEGALARFGNLRFRYAGRSIQCLAFSPDGTELACGGSQGIRCWETATGKPIHTLGEHVDSIAFLKDGRRILAGGNNVVVYDIASGTEVIHFPLQGGLRHCTISRDENLLAGVQRDGALILADATNGAVLRALEGHKGNPAQIMSVDFSPDAKWLASACFQDAQVLIWDAASGKVKHSLPGHDRPLVVRSSPNGRVLGTGDGAGVIRLWDAATGQKIQELRGPARAIMCLAFSSDGMTLVSGADRRMVTTSEAVLPPPKLPSPSAKELPYLVAVAVQPPPKPDLLIETTVQLWDLKTGSGRPLPGPLQWTETVAFSPDGKTLAAGGGGTLIHLIDIATGKEQRPANDHDGWIRCAALSPDGSTLASGGDDNFIHLWDTKTTKEKGRIAGHGGLVTGLAFTPDGHELVSCAFDRTVRVWDWRRGSETRHFAEMDGGHHAFALAPDGHTLVLSTGQLWNVDTGKQSGAVPNYKGLQFRPLFSPDSKRMIGRPQRVPVVLNVSTGEEICRFAGHTSCLCAAFAPDGARAASGGTEGQAFIWDARTGRTIRRLQGHEGTVSNVVFSPDGRMLATAGGGARNPKDYSVRLWEVLTGKERRRFVAHKDSVTSILFSRNGTTLFSGSYDGTALLWDVAGVLQASNAGQRDEDALWRDLASEDAGVAYESVCAMAARNEVSLLSKRLKPVEAVDAAKIDRLVFDLDSSAFATRQQAENELARLRELAGPRLRGAFKESASAELRRRIETLLKSLDSDAPSARTIQDLRAVEVLERIGTADANRVLEKLAMGAPEAWLTQEAKASLARLAKQKDTTP